MSAIVAKALNDSLGTADFKGFNTILEESLAKTNSSIEKMVEDLPPKIEEAIKSGSSAALVVGTSENMSTIFDLGAEIDGEVEVDVGETVYIGRPIKFQCSGFVEFRYNYNNKGGQYGYLTLEKTAANGEKTEYILQTLSTSSEYLYQDIITIPIYYGDVLRFYASNGSTSYPLTVTNVRNTVIRTQIIPNASLLYL